MSAAKEHPAALLGRICATVGYDYATASMVFRSVYVASAMVAGRNSPSKAAEIAGIHRANIYTALGGRISRGGDDA